MFKDLHDQQDILSKRKKHSRIFYFYGFLGFLFCFVLAGVGLFYFIVNSNFFKVKEINISDVRLISKDQILTAVISKKVSTGWRAWLGPDNILFWLGREPVGLDESLAILADLSLAVNLRQKKVSITVEERDFVGVWCGSGGRCFAFDETGIVFSLAPKTSGNLILTIQDENEREMNLGQRVLPDPLWFKNMTIILSALKEAQFLPADVLIKNYELKEWEVKSHLGPSFYFSFAFVPGDLPVVLKNLAGRINFSKISYLDFRVSNRIFYK
ncbi:MAG: hypothetical protein QMD50_01415 [Patescibacteria group bacterium]|nr:hypothetical protein [Patescibacteria group bacterium]